MTDNNSKDEGAVKSPPFGSVSIFTSKKEEGALANADAPAVVDSQEETVNTDSKEQTMGKIIQFPVASLENKQGVFTGLESDLEYEDEEDDDTDSQNLDSRNNNESPIIGEDIEPEFCGELKFNLYKSAFSLASFFPDSHYAVILKNGYYYAANLGTELIEVTPYLQYETVLIADSLVVLYVTHLDNSNSMLLLSHKLDGKRYRQPSEAKLEKLVEGCIQDGSYEFKFAKEYFSLVSRGEKKEVNNSTGTITYKSGVFKYNTNGWLVFEEPNGVELLLADNNGCYVGFYLPVIGGVGGKILLGDDYYVNPKRLTQTLMVLSNEKTEAQAILTCSRPMLIELSDLGIKDYTQIEVSNGVALITQEVKGSTCINVFTPKHQRIIIERGVKIDTLSIGNGVYLPTEGVMLLDDGRLIFAREDEDGSVIIRGKRIELPHEFLEID